MDKFKSGFVRAKLQATSILQDTGTKIASSSSDIAQRSFTLPGLSRQAGDILRSFLGELLRVSDDLRSNWNIADPNDKKTALNAIPKSVLLRAKGTRAIASQVTSFASKHRFTGLAVFRVIKAGFVFSGKAGSGVVIARLPDGSWSAPSCIGTGGLGWGLQVGADVSDFVIVLNSDEAVRAFSKGGNVTIGGNLSATAGPIGTGGAVQTALINPSPMLSYSKSKGEFFRILRDILQL